MRRGEIRLVSLDPVRGAESDDITPATHPPQSPPATRPGVIVSNDGANAAAARHGRGVVTVVPVTSNVAKVFPFQVQLGAQECGLKQESKAQAEQVRSVAVERVGRRVGRLPAAVLAKLDDALRLHLSL